MVNRRGQIADQLSFGFLFFFFVLVGAAIVWAVTLVFGAGIDVRERDAGWVASAIENCVFEKGNEVLSYELFFSSCSFVQSSLEGGYVLSVREEGKEVLRIGDPSVCGLAGVQDNPAYPFCVYRSFVFQGRVYEIDVGSFYQARRNV